MYQEDISMNKDTKLYSVLAYFTWIGWLVAYYKRDKQDHLVTHHLNQAFTLNIASIIARRLLDLSGVFNLVGNVLSIVTAVLSIMGIYRALNLSDDPLPLIGDFKIID